MPDSGGVSRAQSALCRNKDKGGLRMTRDFVIALVTCVATVICTVIAVLSYFRNKR